MAKVYTAQEMREMADRIWDYETMSKGLELCDNELEQVDCEATHDLIHMLRQAANAMERKKKREKRYEYTIRYVVDDGSILFDERWFDSIDDARSNIDVDGYESVSIVRREVGGWEEVKNEEL